MNIPYIRRSYFPLRLFRFNSGVSCALFPSCFKIMVCREIKMNFLTDKLCPLRLVNKKTDRG